MNKRAPSIGNLLTMVLFAVSSFGGLLFLWISFGGTTPLAAKGYRVTVDIPEAVAVATQADVRISGVSVGKLITLTRHGTRTRATLAIDREFAPLPRDTRAILRRKTLLGEAYIELTPGNRQVGAPMIAEGGQIPDAHVGSTVEIDEVLKALNPPSRRNLQRWLAGWSDAVDRRAQNISDITGMFPSVVDDAGGVLGVMARQRVALQRLTADAGTVFATFGRRDQSTRKLISSGNDVFRATASESRALSATIRALPGFLHRLRTLSPVAGRLSRMLSPSLRELQPVAGQLDNTVQGTERVGLELRATARPLDGVTRRASSGLRALQQVVQVAGPLLDRFSPLAGNLVPAAQFLNAYRTDFTRSWAMTAAATEKTAPSASGRQTHYVRLIIPLSNETLNIAKDRSPFSRSNPYPAPGGLAHIKDLQAFSCQHLSNPPPLVPPIIGLGGPPPCKAQGPIDAGGRHPSMFPQLVQAAP